MPKIVPKPGTIMVCMSDGNHLTVNATIVGSLAVFGKTLFHVKTGLTVYKSGGSVHLAEYLNKECRWKWADDLEFGQKAEGRGATMLIKSINEAIGRYVPE